MRVVGKDVFSKREKKFGRFQKSVYLCKRFQDGVLAHLARAFDWQSKGNQFDSDILHKSKEHICVPFFIPL